MIEDGRSLFGARVQSENRGPFKASPLCASGRARVTAPSTLGALLRHRVARFLREVLLSLKEPARISAPRRPYMGMSSARHLRPERRAIIFLERPRPCDLGASRASPMSPKTRTTFARLVRSREGQSPSWMAGIQRNGRSLAHQAANCESSGVKLQRRPDDKSCRGRTESGEAFLLLNRTPMFGPARSRDEVLRVITSNTSNPTTVGILMPVVSLEEPRLF